MSNNARARDGVGVPPTGGPIVYTDGACKNNGRHNARGGKGVYWGPNDRRNVSEALRGCQTNNRAEIQAAVRALDQAREQELDEITIRSDSRLLVKGMTEWIDDWQENGWRKANGEWVKNRADFKDVVAASDGIRVNWEHVKAHSGDVGNDAADELARTAENDVWTENEDKNHTGSENEDENHTGSENEDENHTGSVNEDENHTGSENEDENHTGSENEDKNHTGSQNEDENHTGSENEDENNTGTETEDENDTETETDDGNDTPSEYDDENATDSE